jgi:secreted PhoX family phosphatase
LDANRREFLQFLTGLSLSSLALSSCIGGTAKIAPEGLPFIPLDFTNKDDFVLAKGFESSLLISEGDAISAKDYFGCNNDYTAFIPLSSTSAILWVNHEYPNPLFVSGHIEGTDKTKEMVDKERYACGGSLVHIEKDGTKWQIKKESPFNRRISGETEIPMITPRDIAGSKIATGTFANCAGGVTPWKSILTCEENYHDFYGEREREDRPLVHGKLEWAKFYQNPPEHYGWVVEVNPKTGVAKKLTGLGRFSHECATCIRTKDGRVAVYSGDDKAGEFLYKFISDTKDSLDKGELFVANISEGKWVSLSRDKNKLLKKNFKDQTDVLIHAREAARLLGATPLDRPEDIEIHPKTGDVFICLTNNYGSLNFHGKILKISESGNDHGSMSFNSSDFMMGGDDFSCPDNMVFDKWGHLWMSTDISGGSMNKPPYSKFKNNGLFYIPTSGKLSGQVFQVASAPRDAELTGITLSEDGNTLFVSVQHPGEKSKSLDKLTSHWPNGGSSTPKSSVMQIQGKLLSKGIKV